MTDNSRIGQILREAAEALRNEFLVVAGRPLSPWSHHLARAALAAADAVDEVRANVRCCHALTELEEVEARLAEVEAERDELRSQLARRFIDSTAPIRFARLLMDSTADAAATARELRLIYNTDPVVHAIVSYGRLAALAPPDQEPEPDSHFVNRETEA